MNGYIGINSVVEEVDGHESSKIFNHCRVYKTELAERATIGDYSTVRESSLGEKSSIQRYGDIWGAHIGRYTCVGRVSTIQETEIGSFCALADYMTIGCDDHDYEMLTTHPFWHDTSWGISDDVAFAAAYREHEFSQPCAIGNDVWIGAGVNICRNVRIGDGCVIGAGAVITRDLAPYSVVVGVPGRVIKKRFDDNTIERLEKSCWWDLPIPVIRDNLALFRDRHLDARILEEIEALCSLHGVCK